MEQPNALRLRSQTIERPTRFQKQLSLIEAGKADVVGAWIREFDHHPGDMETVRKVPETHDEVWRYAKRRSPMGAVEAAAWSDPSGRLPGWR